MTPDGQRAAGFAGQGKLTASEGAANDEFGSAVALSGDTAIVGAYAASTETASQLGSAYVFVRSGGAWTMQQKLSVADGFAGDQFGWSVAINGDTAIVGARAADIGTTLNQGSAYVFVRSGSAWSLQQRLTASDGAAGDEFGYSVAVAGDTVLVGARYADIDNKANQGAVYVFTRSGSTWTQQKKLTASDGAAGDEFGYSVALSDQAVLVGARWADMGSSANRGAAYVFHLAAGNWNELQKLTASDGGANDEFGGSVALSGDTALVGAMWDVGAGGSQGSAYVFVRREGTWIEQAKLTAADGGPADRFGRSVALSGDRALVGAYLADVGGMVDQGAAYLFGRSHGAWSQRQKLTSPEPAALDWFGWSVAVSGDTALVGVPRDNVGSNADQGSADVFFTSAPQVTTISTVSAASFLRDGPLAPASIAAGFGEGLADAVQVAPPEGPLPESIAGVSVKVKDSAGVERLAPLWFISPTQINYYIADGAALGPASVSVLYDSQTVATGTVSIERVAPALFGMNADGQGVPAALAVFVNTDGTRTWQYVFNSGCQVGACRPEPIDLGLATDRVVLELYGTGIRGRTSREAVSAKIGGVDAPVEYAGPVEGLVGLDQVNVRVPRSLAGRGEVDIALTVDGKPANPMRISIK